MSLLRLDKYLADAGQGTRSSVRLLIKQGRVKIGDRVAKRPEEKIDTGKDGIFVDGKSVVYSEFEYYMLNKPAGVVSAVTDKSEKTVIELITGDKRRDLFPVGRLDKDTEGLLLITNDGKLANELLSPKKHVEKTYYAVISGRVTEETIRQFKEGLDIGDEKLTKPAELKITKAYENKEMVTQVEITITEGRYHQIKRMFQSVGMEVVYLKRLSMGNISLDAELPCGSYRKLTEDEIALLKKS